jgi:hypothetical protein
LEPVVKSAINTLLGSLSPDDRVVYVSSRRRARFVLEPGKQEDVRRQAEAMVTGPGVLWTCVSDMLINIERVASTIPRGRSSFVAMITRGPFDRGPAFPADEGIGCTPRREDLRQMQNVISAAQINLHLFTVDHLSRSWGLDTVAANTGGGSGLLTWSDASGLQRAAKATRGFYRLTFAADPRSPRRPQRVDLRVSRPGVKVLTSHAIEIHGGAR